MSWAIRRIALLLSFLFCSLYLFGRAEKMRIVWVENPSYQARVGWSSTTKQLQTLYVGLADHGKDTLQYQWKYRPQIVHRGYKGMLTQFVRLNNLLPNSKYFLVWGDKTSVSRTYYFETAPDEPSDSLSLVIGGDSRNNREARQHANILVGRLRPDAVLFAGDMTDEDKSTEWQEWLDDWQLTRCFDRRLTPIIPARGNHERSNEVMEKLFDLPEEAYYAQTIGGSLLRVYTLNTESNIGGKQADWLERDLNSKGRESQWKLVQYHKPIRPHVRRKREGNDQYEAWAKRFYKHGVQLVYECDGHLAKVTWPLRPDNEPGSQEGFSRDDRYGTIYLGEGGWGAPLREVNDSKKWTRAAGSFNHINLLWVRKNSIEIRFIKVPEDIGKVLSISTLTNNNRFTIPRNMEVWQLPFKQEYIEMLSEARKSEFEKLINQALQGDLFEEENKSSKSLFFTAFRNPLSKNSQLSLACYAQKRQVVELYVFDQRGREVYKKRLRIQEGDNRIRLETGQELLGVYYLAIRQTGGSQVIKVVLE